MWARLPACLPACLPMPMPMPMPACLHAHAHAHACMPMHMPMPMPMPCRPAVVLSYLVSATAALLSALCYTEMAVSLPITGEAVGQRGGTPKGKDRWCGRG